MMKLQNLQTFLWIISVGATSSLVYQGGYLKESDILVKPNQPFTLTCANTSKEFVYWSLEGIQGITTIRNSSQHSITCYFTISSPGHRLDTLVCKNPMDGSWQKKLDLFNKYVVPKEQVFLSDCCNPETSCVPAITVALPPQKPTNLSCLFEEQTLLHCRWDVDPFEKRYIANRTFETKYNVSYSVERIHEFDDSKCRALNWTHPWCDFDTYISFGYHDSHINVTVTAWNAMGKETTSIYETFRHVTSAPEFHLESVSRDKESSLLMVDVALPEHLIYDVTFEVESKYAELRLPSSATKPHFSFWDQWKEHGDDDISGSGQGNDFWANSTLDRFRLTHTSLQTVQHAYPAHPNSTVWVRVRSRHGNFLWSPYKKAKSIRTAAVVPNAPEVQVLWFRSDNQRFQGGIVLWKQARYSDKNNITTRSFLLQSSCPRKEVKATEDGANCSVKVSATNEIGTSQQNELITLVSRQTAESTDKKGTNGGHLELQNATLTVKNATTAALEFNCVQCLDKVSPEHNLTATVFFWPVQSSWYNADDLIRHLVANADNKSESHIQENSNSIYLSSFNNRTKTMPVTMTSGIADIATNRVTPQFTTCKARRLSNGKLGCLITSDFQPLTAYVLAVSMRCDQVQGPAFQFQSAYYFTTSKPRFAPHFEVGNVKRDSLKVTWESLDPHELSGPVEGYTILVSLQRNCGFNPVHSSTSGDCKATCPHFVKTEERQREDSEITSRYLIGPGDLHNSVNRIHSIAVVEGLQPDTTYYVRIYAWNHWGSGPCSETEKIRWNEESNRVNEMFARVDQQIGVNESKLLPIILGVLLFLVISIAIAVGLITRRKICRVKYPKPYITPQLFEDGLLTGVGVMHEFLESADQFDARTCSELLEMTPYESSDNFQISKKEFDAPQPSDGIASTSSDTRRICSDCSESQATSFIEARPEEIDNSLELLLKDDLKQESIAPRLAELDDDAILKSKGLSKAACLLSESMNSLDYVNPTVASYFGMMDSLVQKVSADSEKETSKLGIQEDGKN